MRRQHFAQDDNGDWSKAKGESRDKYRDTQDGEERRIGIQTDSKDEGGSSGPVTRVAQKLPRAHSLESSASTNIRRESLTLSRKAGISVTGSFGMIINVAMYLELALNTGVRIRVLNDITTRRQLSGYEHGN